MKFREVNEIRETKEEKEKRSIKESNLSKLIKERNGELEMRKEILDQPIAKEINNEEKGEVKMEVKDYVGYLVGENVELDDFEIEFMELEKARFDKVIPIDELKDFVYNASIALKEIDVLECDEKEKTIFEGLKGVNIMFKILEDGDTYKTFQQKLANNKELRREYNIITSNIFQIYKEAGSPKITA